MRVLVIGGTGETGRRAVERLRARDCAVRVSGRDPDRVRARFGDGIEAVRGDLRDPASLIGVADGVDAVILAAGSRTYFGANGGAAVDAQGTRNLVAAMAGSGAKLVLLGAYGVDRRAPALSVFSKALGGYFAHKAAAEEAVRGSGLPYAIVRPVELWNRPPRGGVLLNQGAPMSLLAAGRGVSRDAVADVLVHCAVERDAGLGTTFELFEGDGGTLAAQLAALVPDAAGRPIPATTPVW